MDHGTPPARPGLDVETIRAVRRREARALEIFFDHYFDRAFACLGRLIDDRDEVEALAQEAFLRMFGSCTSSTRRGSLHLGVHGRRQHARDYRRSGSWRAAHRRDDEETAEEEALTRALCTLRPLDREVILLRTRPGWTRRRRRARSTSRKRRCSTTRLTRRSDSDGTPSSSSAGCLPARLRPRAAAGARRVPARRRADAGA